MAEVEFTILMNLPQVSLDEGRAGKFDRLITFQTKDGRTGAVKVHQETMTAQTISKAVSDELKLQGQFVGHTLRAQV